MKKRKIIQLMHNARVPHMRNWCDACKAIVKLCKKNGRPLAECENIESLQWRFVGFIPGTKRRIVRSLGRDYYEALKQVATLRQQLDEGNVTPVQKKPVPNASVEAAAVKPELLTHLFGKYLATLKGEGVPSHLRLVRTKSHYNDVKNSFRQFLVAMKNAGYSPASFTLHDINDEVVGKYHEYITSKGYSSKSYNRFFSHFTTFASWCEREGYPSVKRFFEKVPRKTFTPRPEVITAEDFKKTLSVISPENGWQYGIGKRKEKRNHYRDYLVPAFRFSLTGRRLEELIMAKFSDVHTDEDGRPLVIEFTDYKVSRILRAAPGDERKVYSPVTRETAEFLHAQGWESKKGTDAFIIAPEIMHNRVATMKLALTRGFTHFWKVAHPDKPVKTHKVLRKVFMTALKIRMRGDITSVSGHSGEQVLAHYVDELERHKALASSMQDFTVFKEKEPKGIRKARSPNRSLDLGR